MAHAVRQNIVVKGINVATIKHRIPVCDDALFFLQGSVNLLNALQGILQEFGEP